MHTRLGAIFLAALVVAFGPSVRAQPTTGALVAVETTQEMLAAQICLQGFTCDKPHGAVSEVTGQCCVRKQSAFIRWIGIASGSRSRLCSTAAGACADRPFLSTHPAGPAGGVFVCPARAVLIPNPSPASGCAFLHNARDAPLNIKL